MADDNTLADAAAAALKANDGGVAAKLAADAVAEKAVAEKAVADKAASGEDKDAAAKVAADKTVADKAAADKDLGARLAGAPETYEAFTAEDGAEIDKGLLERVTPLAKKLGLTQDKAQDLVNSETARIKQEVTAETEAWGAMQTEWRNASKSDKEIGGPKYDETVGHAVAFIKAFGNEVLIEAMKTTGVINHPEFLRAFAKAGAAIGEDKLHIGNAPKAGERSQAERIFPNHAK